MFGVMVMVRVNTTQGGREGGRMSTSRRTSSYVITSDCY